MRYVSLVEMDLGVELIELPAKRRREISPQKQVQNEQLVHKIEVDEKMAKFEDDVMSSNQENIAVGGEQPAKLIALGTSSTPKRASGHLAAVPNFSEYLNQQMFQKGEIQDRKSRPRQRGSGHCRCCTCTHSQSPSPIRRRRSLTPKQTSGNLQVGNDDTPFLSPQNAEDAEIEVVHLKTGQPAQKKSFKSEVEFTGKSKMQIPEDQVSAYDYKGPVKVLCSQVLGKERRKDYCLFCKKLTANYKRHYMEEHIKEEEVQLASEMETNGVFSAWKYLQHKGNDVHNNLPVLHSQSGYIIPGRLSFGGQNLVQLVRCKDCRMVLCKSSLSSHRKLTCIGIKWQAYLNTRKQKRAQKENLIRILQQNQLSKGQMDFLMRDELTEDFLTTMLTNNPNKSEKDMAETAMQLANFFALVKTLRPDITNYMQLLSIANTQLLAETIRRRCFTYSGGIELHPGLMKFLRTTVFNLSLHAMEYKINKRFPLEEVNSSRELTHYLLSNSWNEMLKENN
ncbi:uncharacterized protein LOC132196687 isoform X2 [Neocloeon triangulifer]|uniref:uncharacterized protein LOC132196687 isoform X2 n=1 Tax=Neocloeon triangulifer TaxID=2078957 RepID=UPI00286ED5CC|nr:uncharacterized protein LOC132196687 isoform X2 [Neocloeon triangulifer]